jgi:hypothetical protein
MFLAERAASHQFRLFWSAATRPPLKAVTAYTVEDGLVQSALFLGILDVLLDVTKPPLNLA